MDSAISSSVKQCNAMASQSSTGVNLLLHPLLYQSHRFVLECIPVATFSLGRTLWKKLGHEFQAVERNISSFPVKPTLTAIPSFSGRDVLKSLALLSARKKKKSQNAWKLSKTPLLKWHLKSILRNWLSHDVRAENCIHFGRFFPLLFYG